jgi:hypothetical protein
MGPVDQVESHVKFWKFEAPRDDQIQSLLVTGRLPPPVVVPGLLDTYGEVASKLKEGDGVVLASLKGEEGKITAFGKVRVGALAAEQLSIQWARASHGVYPTGSGLEHWRAKTAFEISALPAERYGLRQFIEYHLKDAE